MASFIEFPIFTGVAGELRPWISELEDFFVRERFTEDEKMNLAQSLLEGEANAWFYSSRKRFAFQSWEHLVVKILIWRFGDFGDFGVFSDPELFLLWDKYDRIFQAQRVEKMRKRMETISLNLQESISNHQKIVDEFPGNVAENLDGKASEKKLISQFQVSVSSLEHSLQISKESPNVCENSQAVAGCEHPRSIQKNIRMDVVNGDVERIQRVMSITKNVSAHQVFDKMFPHKERLKPRNKRKVSLSLKTWKFKFKNKMLQRNRSQMDPHHVIDSNIIKYIRYSSRAKFGYWWKEHNSRYWRRMRQTHMSKLLCNLRVRQDPRGLGQLILDDLKSHMRLKWKSKHLRAVFDLQNSPSYALDVVNKTSKPWGTHMTFTSKPVASVNSLSFEVVTDENMFMGLSQTSQVWEPGGVVAANVLVDWLLLLEFVLFIHLEDKVCLSGASNSWCGWLVFDRGKNNKWDVHVDSLIVRIKVILSCGVALRKQIQWAEIQKLSLYKEFWIEIMDGDITKLLNSTGGKHTVSTWELYLSSVFSTVTSANSGWLQGLLEQVFQGDDEAYTKIFDKLQLNLKQGMDSYRASGHRLFLRQQSSSSIWHRWRRKD